MTHKRIAPMLGIGGAMACTATVVCTLALGLYSVHVLVYATFIAAGILGALVSARQPGHSVGRIMSIASVAAILFYLPLDYGYAALVLRSGSWPLGKFALWFGAWAWAPLLGLFLPMLTVRFPDGQVTARWRVVDWLAIGGTVVFAAGIALGPSTVNARFLQVPAQVHQAVRDAVPQGPLPVYLSPAASETVIAIGFGLMLLGYLAAVLSMIDRMRRATDVRRRQLKWFAYAGVVVVAAELVGAAGLMGGWDLGMDVEIAVHLVPFMLPLAIAIAILHHGLYDIDLLINRTLVYGGLTAVLAATYTAGIMLFQRLFVAVTGAKSDAAYVLTAFVIVVGFTPAKNWLQGLVDRSVGRPAPSAALDELASEVEAVVSVIDGKKAARQLVDRASRAFDADGAAIYVPAYGSTPLYSRGHVDGGVSIAVSLRHMDRDVGRLIVGRRRGGAHYSKRDHEVLQRSADAIGEALALAERLGLSSTGTYREGGPRPPPQGGGSAL